MIPGGTKAIFIAGSHTDVGKTHVACALIHAARTAGLAVDALKPVASGFEAADPAASDSGRLIAALGEPLTEAALERITPWRLAAPLAPPMAAAAEGRSLPLGPIADLCRSRLAACRAELFIVEGAGGLMSPLAEDGTNLDLMRALGLPAILVGGSYLGAISHTLTALEVLRARGLTVPAVVMSQDADAGAPDFAASVDMVARHAEPTPVLAAARSPLTDWAHALLARLLLSATA
jgi:dethiobiotin synthetase